MQRKRKHYSKSIKALLEIIEQEKDVYLPKTVKVGKRKKIFIPETN